MKVLSIVAFVAVVGWAAAVPSSRSLKSDLDEFVALIPVEKIREVTRKYIANDAEVQRVVKYLQSEEWNKLTEAVRNNPSWQELKKYLNEAGVDIEGLINAIRDLIAGQQVPTRATRSLRNYLDEVKALLPVGPLLELLNDKLDNSDDFKALWAQITSEQSHKLVDEVRAIPEVKRIAQVLRDLGADVDKVINLIYVLFGWA